MKSSFVFKFSKDFWLLFFIASLLMFGFAFYLGTTVLYLHQNFNIMNNVGYKIIATFSAAVYFCSVLAGYFTQTYLNPKTGLVFGILLYGIGTILSGATIYLLYLVGLTIFAVGYGFIFTNTFYLLGKLYLINDPKRESSFTLTYMGFNLGAVIGFFLGGIAIEQKIYSSIVIFIGIGFITIAILLGWKFFPKYIARNTTSYKKICIFYIAVFFLVAFLWLILKNAEKIQWILLSVSVILLLSIYAIAYKERHNKTAAKKLYVLGLLTLATVVYWTIYRMQDGLLINFFQYHVNRVFNNYLIPAPTLLGIDPFVILLVSPLVSIFWMKFGARYNTPHNKVFLGLALFGFSFLFLIIGVKLALPMSLVFAIVFLVLLALSEVILGPGTISMVGQLADEKYHAILLGMVQLSTTLGSIFSGQISVLLSSKFLLQAKSLQHGYMSIFIILAISLILAAFYSLFLRRIPKNGV